MLSTVLGKRTRSSTDGADAILTRSKRRVVDNQRDDEIEKEIEQENPFVSHRQVGVVSQDVVSGDKPAKRTRLASTRKVPTKHSVPIRRDDLSPAKISAHFKVAKAGIEVYRDGKGDAIPIPNTPRHRDALSKKVPVTPRHRVLLAGGQLTPKTPITPSASSTSIYNQARQLFSRCSNPGKLVGREAERQELSTFLDRCLASDSAGCLYVSGPPGTGKSALVDEVRGQCKGEKNIKTSTVNCMSVRNAKDLAQKLAEDLGLKADGGFDYLQSCFVGEEAQESHKYVVILDEVDRLVDMDLELLHSLFEWSMHASSRLVLIGIANALDLTDRFLPRLKSRNLKPELLPFMPYSASQIAEVLTLKLRSLVPGTSSHLPFAQPAALQFCAKKVAAQTGDLRKAFDICRRAIDLVEQETRENDATAALQNSPSKTPLMENINLSSAPSPRSKAGQTHNKSRIPTLYTLDTAPKATIAHMARITALVFGNNTTQRLATLNLQQKAVLCALAALEKRKRDSQPARTIFATPSKKHKDGAVAPSIKQLFEAYTSLCKREKLLHPLSAGEFRDVVEGLETLSLVTSGVEGKMGSLGMPMMPMTPSRTPSRKGKGGFGTAAGGVGYERKVASSVGWGELRGCVEGGAGGEILREIMEGGGLL
ncbi:AAA ATPase [Friedmanniomyces endolithicus]|uniref:Cell division control protein n=1 Tax=Friedmanniomyces endolithicus TaxID=329885 RepID=A0A4U0VHA3_9PEZI|nr:AAA ATPase [Friedmanniomyces endolithicus]KAK0355939.1 AAA ATPase [Friedmanniomyces endolithicus]KAK0798920.1 AAA ATPase [Friedmanniomyces endolithicus]KAK0803444.1 AAA ATPase [Friedmanniomyces endolithicus]KAK0870994.1 AAA ATPase [Friedmanniomyces endolithicus]